MSIVAENACLKERGKPQSVKCVVKNNHTYCVVIDDCRYLRRWSLGVMPSFEETSSNVSVETQTADTEVITARKQNVSRVATR